MAVDYRAAAQAAAQKYGIDPGLFTAQIQQESGFNPNARSGAGAIGIAQIMPATARGWGVDPTNPLAALDAAARNMAAYAKKYGGYRNALIAYNAGPGAVGRSTLPTETQNYIKIIMGNAGRNVHPLMGQGFTGVTAAQPNTATGDGLDRAGLGRAALAMRGPGESLSSVVRRAFAANPLQFRSSGGSTVPLSDGPPSGVPTVKGASAAQNMVVGAAMARQGTPYAWGGGTPSGPSKGFAQGANTVGFDCSSLVQYAWAKVGVKLPRTTYGQIKSGTAVANLSQARPGDLLFPHAGHVQMYIGNGKVVEAPYTGAAVRVVPVGSHYIAIRRPG